MMIRLKDTKQNNTVSYTWGIFLKVKNITMKHSTLALLQRHIELNDPIGHIVCRTGEMK